MMSGIFMVIRSALKTKCLYDRMGKKIKKEAEPQPKQGFETLPIESKNAATVILMLQSPEEEVVVKALEAIYKFAEKGDENKSSLMALGAVEPLTCLLKHDSKIVCKNAFMALGVMVSDKDVKRLIKKLNIIPSIITKLAPEEDVTVLEFATLLLAHLSVDMTCKVQIFHNDGLKPLLTLLSSTDPDVKKQSVECIYNLVQELSSRVAVHTFNGIPPLLELLSSEFPIIQQFALRTLETINKDRDSRTAFREQNGFARILEFLTKKEFSDLHVEALKVISNCMEDTESMQLIQENGGLENLLQFLITPTAHDIQATAVETISKAAQSSENRKILHEQNVEKAIIELLAVENDSIHTAVCQAVSAMSENLSSRDTFRQFDGIKLIVQLLNSEGDRVKEVAAEALSSLTHANQPNAYAVYEAEGDKLLVQLLQNGSPPAVVHATAVLINMASQEVIRSRIISHGAIQALLKPLYSTDKHTLTNVTQAVAALTCDAEGRAELRSVGALPQLVNLLTSKYPDVRRNVCWAVTVCATDEPTATEMCRLGALEILQEINSSLSRKNKFSEAALQRLLDSNLSLKYSLTGCLFPTDITTDGFYDPGQTKDGQRIPGLEDIAKQVINQRRAVIAVNGNPPDETITDSQEKGQQQSPTESQISTVMSSQGSVKTTSKSKAKAGQEDEIQSHDNECKPQEEAVVEKPWTLPYDAQLNNLIKETFKSVLPLHDEVEMYTAVAKLVCDAMGGPIDIEQQYDFLWELHLSELKVEMQSNIIPIGKIKKGTYYHRALLFKVLSDRIGLSCSLVRGDYNRAWNEVLLPSTTTRATGLYPHLQTYIIDLMHKPGTLMKCETPAAEQYQTI
ncbi:armadillo repeat-containing protein 3 isoform X1 [Tachysurus fulvidraco]|uniref:armadillo repeat-containing protein 3 isoform X1 n=2 Tax=Tachysurus fulvidraco TaxID=1234273 RepID=UPI001FEE9607|nr:armadillo repeat-containing protein 3 isoform X1 [Tachysurus fulvidraco]